jgi:hypothetical protein
MLTKLSLSLFAALPLLGMAHAPAYAIKCDGRFQIVQGQPVSTPYCEDNYLAYVARTSGIRVSGAAIRQNPRLKDEVCHVVGSDPRVADICIGHVPDGPGFPF